MQFFYQIDILGAGEVLEEMLLFYLSRDTEEHQF